MSKTMLTASKKQAILRSFDRQQLMALYGAEVIALHEDCFEIGLVPKKGLLRSSGAFNGGVLSALADTAGGFAIITIADEPHPYLVTVSLNIEYLRPAIGSRIIARGHPVKYGKNISVASVDIFAEDKDKLIKVAIATANYMQVKPIGYEHPH